MKLSTLFMGTALLAAVATDAQATMLSYGDVVQVQNREGTVFTPTPILGDSNGLYTSVSFQANGSNRTANAGMYVLDYSYTLNNSAGEWFQFYSFCLEPHVNLQSFSNPYTVHTLSSAGYNNAAISELWGRYRSSVTNNLTAAAFQLALWELAHDQSNGINLAQGAFSVNNAGSNAFQLANTWLNSLNGEGPRAWNLAVLVDNPGDKNNRQDLIVELPNPGALALFSFGAFLLAGKRRKF